MTSVADDRQPGKVFHAVLPTKVNSETKARLSKLKVLDPDFFFLINEDAMDLHGLATGSPCLINGHHILNSWSCNSLPADGVLLPQHLTEVILGPTRDDGRIVSVLKFIPNGSEAERVEIELESERADKHVKIFLEFLKNRMAHRYIAENSKHVILHMGQKWAFWIRKIKRRQLERYQVTVSKRPPSPAKGDSEEMCQNLSALSVSDVSDSGDSSTPLKQADATSVSASSTPVGGNMDQLPDELSRLIALERENLENFARFVEVTSQTRFVIQEKSKDDENVEKVMFTSLVGMDSQIKELRHCLSLLSLPKAKQTPLTDMIIPQGILISGPKGTGKTMLARAIVNELAVHACFVSPNSFKNYLEPVQKMKEIIQSACERSPSCIIIEDIDFLCPLVREGDRQSAEQKRNMHILLSLIHDLSQASPRHMCVVIGTTSTLLDPAIRKSAFFDIDIEIGLPGASERLQIVKKVLKDVSHNISDSDLKGFADTKHFYTGAELFSIIHDCLKMKDKSTALKIEHLEKAALSTKPHFMGDIPYKIPQVRWSDIGGHEEVKLKLRQSVEWPVKHPEAFERMGISPLRGCLLYGPRDCGKTMLARAAATESGLACIEVKASDVLDSHVGEIERKLSEIFLKAKLAAPSIIFFDKFDEICHEELDTVRVKAMLLSELESDSMRENVSFLAATNRPEVIDKALLRPGRFDSLLYVPMPDLATRKEIMQIFASESHIAPDVCLDDLAKLTENFSGSEVNEVCKQAASNAVKEDDGNIHWRHFHGALQKVVPKTTSETVKFFENFRV